MTDPTTRATHVNVKSENSTQTSELQSLTDKNKSLDTHIKDLRSKEDKWNGRNRLSTVLALVAGGLFGGFAWFSQQTASDKARDARPYVDERDNNEKRIRKLLDAQSAQDIAAAQTAAGEAGSEAGRANERANKLEQQNISLRTDLQKAEAESDRRHTELANAQKETALAQKSAADAQLELKRHIEQVAAPREVADPRGNINNDHGIRMQGFEEVSKFAGTVALIQPIPNDFEALSLSRNIVHSLTIAGWKPVLVDEASTKIPSGYIRPGVTLYTLEKSPFEYGPPPEVKLVAVEPSRAAHAARALMQLLALDLGPNESNPSLMGVWLDSELDDDHTRMLTRYGFVFPPDSVVILVGLKPADRWWPHMTQQTSQGSTK